MKGRTTRNMPPERFNTIAKIVFALSMTVSVFLVALGLAFAPVKAQAEGTIPLDKFILSAQGTRVERISPDVPKTVEQLALQASMDRLATNEQRTKAERLVASQISGFKDRQAQIKAEKESEARSAAQAAATAGQKSAALDVTKQHYATLSGPSGHIDVSEQSNGSPSPATPVQAPNTVNVLGETIPFVDAYGAKRAPEHGCGVWRGDDPVDDGKMCYFVGHNPGDFHNVMKLQNGNPVTVSDSNGHIKTYIVHDNFIVAQKSSYGDIASRVEGHGESIALQTCCGDGINVRVVVAW